MKNRILKFGLLAFFWAAYTLPVLADDDPNDPPGDGDDDPSPAPIDNWILILVFAAVAVGFYFLYKQNRKAIV